MSRRPTLLFACFGVDQDAWLDELRRQGPDFDLRFWPDAGDLVQIDYVLAWNAPAGFWARLPNLKAIYSMGAGVDKMLADPELPAGPPLVRMVDPSLVVGMTEYVLMRVLHHHRLMPALEAAQAQGVWRPLRAPLAQERRVGVLGLGQLGAASARALAGLGFEVAGWSRGPKAVDGVEAFVGSDRLEAFAARTEILVCLLPLTPETDSILDARLFAALPQGASVINVARGAHLVEDDLLAALDGGRLSGATLDVFRTEPLPAGHPFWTHPAITVTPHISALTQPRTATATLLANLRDHEAGAPLRDIVDRGAGY